VKFTSQEEYGLRFLLQLARRTPESLTIAELAQAEGVTAPNVAKIMRVLRRSGLVRSTRGQAGGYTLSRPPEEVSVKEALTILGERLFDSGFCDRHAGVESSCINVGECSIRPVLRTVQGAIDQVLETLTLRSLVAPEHEVRLVSPRAVVLPVASRPS